MGRLPTAVTYKATSRTLSGTSKAAWSGVHMTGGTVGKGSRLPARPFLWMSDEFIDQARKRIADVAVDAFGGR